jgi:O-antigen/teichoic acid export membrane protein
MQAVALWSIVLALPGATIFSANLTTLGVALGRVRLASGIAIIQAGANLVAIVPAFLLHAIDLRFALLAPWAVQVIGAGGMLVALWRSIGCSSSGVSTKVLIPFVGAGLKQHIATVSTFVYTRINQLIVFHYCGDKETGLLAASHTLAFGLFAAFGAVQIALYPTVIRNDGDGLGITIRMVRLSLYAGLLLIVPIVLLANPLLRAYGGSQFDEAVWCFRMLAPAAWILSVSSLTAPYYVKAGAFGMASYVSLALGIVSVLSNVLLVPKFAANGAAMATLLTVSVGFVAVLGMIRIISGASPLAALTPDFRQEVAGLVHWLAFRKEALKLREGADTKKARQPTR